MSLNVKNYIKGFLINNEMDTYYCLYSNRSLSQFFTTISGGDFTSWFENLFNKASDTIGSLRAYPISYINLGFLGDSGTLRAGGHLWDIDNHPLDSLKKIYKHTIGRYTFPNASSFIDFSPYTQVQVFIPYMEFVELPINELVGRTLTIEYYVDLASGIAIAYFVTTKNNESHVISIKTGKIGVDIAWGKDNSVENSRNIINTALSTATSLTLMNATKGASVVAKATASARMGAEASKGALSILNSTQTRYERGGSSGCFAYLSSPNSVYMIIKKPKLAQVNEDEYAHTYGKPLYKDYELRYLSGFTIVDQIHLTGFDTALDEEVNEIESLLKSGVHL